MVFALLACAPLELRDRDLEREFLSKVPFDIGLADLWAERGRPLCYHHYFVCFLIFFAMIVNYLFHRHVGEAALGQEVN